MKLYNYIIILLCLLIRAQFSEAQNLLPTDVNAEFTNTASVASRSAKTKTILSTLLSWERQGYFSGDGDCIMTSYFNVSKPNKKYLLRIRMQCDVKRLFVNGKLLAENLENQYWNGKAEYAEFCISSSILHKGTNNIKMECSNLGYTGGTSHTILSLTPRNENISENIRIDIPSADHVFLGKTASFCIHSTKTTDAIINLHIENAFHTTYLDSIIHVSKNDSITHINANNICDIPGFYQITATLHGEGYCGDVQWIASHPENIKCDNTAPSQFTEYWKKALKDLSDIKPCFNIHKIDSLSRKSFRDVYIAEMQSIGNITIRGYYFVPRTDGKHRAVLQVPGYGWGFENIDNMLNEKTDRIELALCVRGHGISADVFNPGFGVPGIWGYKLYEKDSMAYRAIYMDCVRAIEFLYNQKEVDSLRIAVKGGSQGGGLTLATAALCNKRIAACAYFDPFPCDIKHQIKIRTTCETELKNDLLYYGNPCSFDEVMNNQMFTDTRFFASWIKCPVLYTAALFDDDCPVHEGFAAYNLITSPKEYFVYPQDGHIEGFSHDSTIMEWLDNKMK